MWDDFKAWIASPFSADMSAGHWFLFIGLLLVIAMAWGMILRTVKEVA
jgi:hypothetical protein